MQTESNDLERIAREFSDRVGAPCKREAMAVLRYVVYGHDRDPEFQWLTDPLVDKDAIIFQHPTLGKCLIEATLAKREMVGKEPIETNLILPRPDYPIWLIRLSLSIVHRAVIRQPLCPAEYTCASTAGA